MSHMRLIEGITKENIMDITMSRLIIDVNPGEYAVSQLPCGSALPKLEAPNALISVTSTPDEISVVSPLAIAPAGSKVEGGWRLLTVRGPLNFSLTGIMASISGSLARDGVPLFAVSTFNTDHILVKETDLNRAVQALRKAGHDVLYE